MDFYFHRILKVLLMKAGFVDTIKAEAKSIPKIKRSDNLSADGKWRSFPKVPNLLQYVVAGTYYARCKIKGKPVRVALDTYLSVNAETIGFAAVLIMEKVSTARLGGVSSNSLNSNSPRTGGLIHRSQSLAMQKKFCLPSKTERRPAIREQFHP